MKENIQSSMSIIYYITKYFHLHKFRFVFVLLSGLLLFPLQQSRSEEIFLKCTGKYEINRGELIKPDWETSYLTINKVGLKSTIVDNGIKKEGRTLIRRNYYTITHRDNNNRIKKVYKIHGTYGTYMVNIAIKNRTLIGTCQKGKG